ncbi:hypothetical protein BD408DRAFT_344245 [Parasitella parasitica]|nr:hypothetical protein BD408DRAFT_344245 [Parasitella parasitica]
MNIQHEIRKNVVLNYTEMESKVHEATSSDPWGASSTLMQEIAQGTYNYQYFNEIMPTVYRRFTEKEPKQWRQIYKALVLLEYLIKNGSERVVDDARSHVSTIKVMRNFYYIDDKGKDEGLNVRNRAKEIVELLGDTELIRSERKLAKKNRNKYVGIGSDSSGMMRTMGLGGSSSGHGGSRYLGFGSDSYSGGGGLSFNGDALSFGEETPYPHQSGRYDEDDQEYPSQGGYHSDSNQDSFASNSKKAPNDDFDTKQSNDDDDWGEFTWGEPAPTQETKPAAANILDDDFADFQHAVAEVPAQTALKSSQPQDLFDLLGDSSNNTPATPSAGTLQQQSLRIFDSPMAPISQQQPKQQQPTQEEKKPETSTPTGMWAQASNFVSLDSLGKTSSKTSQATGPSMNALKNTSVQTGWNDWASNNQSKPSTPVTKTSSPFDDLLS